MGDARTLVLSAFLTLGIASGAEADWHNDARDCDAAYEAREPGWADRVIKHCTAAIKSGQLSEIRLPSAYYLRGLAYYEKRNYDQAILNYDKVLSLVPENPRVHYLRGNAYYDNRDFGRAIEDYTEAIAINPNYGRAIRDRARVNFYLGKFTAALPDFRRLAGLWPEYAYAPIWIYLSGARSGAPDLEELKQQAARFDLNNWPGPVIRFLLGELAEDELLSRVVDRQTRQQRELRCEVYYYVGQTHLIDGDVKGAKFLFWAVLATKVSNFVEYYGAVSELERIK